VDYVRLRQRSGWERLAPHWRTVLLGAAVLAAVLWFAFERIAS
jgi:hypothetical protein